MNKNKLIIIKESAKLFYSLGYNNTGLSDILKKSKVAKGTFYHYFKSKDDLLYHVIEFHGENIINHFDKTVVGLEIEKLKIFFDEYFIKIEKNDFKGGSILGNLLNEVSDLDETARLKMLSIYKKLEMKISFFLTILKDNDRALDINPEKTSNILISMFEGTLLKTKLEKNSNSIKNFFYVFDMLFVKEEIKEPQNNKTKNIVVEKLTLF